MKLLSPLLPLSRESKTINPLFMWSFQTREALINSLFHSVSVHNTGNLGD